ncbi:hypothetical protein [Phytomonospora endophytica]|uniref:Tetratricopeptide (TPR) repeat protein n=1 Tax=Phytomonospora endophytica TaxID=714109 RepID=A0A841FQ01_9ACTN|nr:hypothetical protein [Phytomonospora endophytica]MBB6036913.1 tetratricopeptide (TPR) repeat protein [Phytomonospora endophytica]GIG68055.1 hypothetical protein Pen01_43500 [Phytomonospora endophytica]
MTRDLYSARVLELDPPARRVRLRVLLVHFERSWGREDLLPRDAGFFFRALWQAADGVAKRRRGPLQDEVGLEEYLDTEWVDANAGRFVEHVEMLDSRNVPTGDAEIAALAEFHCDHADGLDAHLHEWDDPWEAEHRLVAADYDVRVTDPRWLEPLLTGQGWATNAFPSPAAERRGGPASGAGEAYLGLGWVRELDSGDFDGAIRAYERAIETGDAHVKAKAHTAVERVKAKREGTLADDFTAEVALETRAALELCVRLHGEGRAEEARAAYLLAHAAGDPVILAEARRRADMSSPAEHALRLFEGGDRAAATAELRRAYDPSKAVAEVALAVYAGDFEAAAAVGFGGDLERCQTGNAAVDLAFHYGRQGDKATLDALLALVIGTGNAVAAWTYAVTGGSAHPPALATVIGRRLARAEADAMNPEGIRTIAEAAAPAFPAVAAAAYRLLGEHELRHGEDDAAVAGAWIRGAHWSCVTRPGGARAAAAEIAELAELLDGVGETVAAEAARALLTELAVTPATGAVDRHAAFLYGQWFSSAERADKALPLLTEVARGRGASAAKACVTVGFHAHHAGDDDTARRWWVRAIGMGDPVTSRQAVSNLALAAKKRRDLDEATRWFAPLLAEEDDGAALAAAHLGELCYWLEDLESAVGWYGRTLELSNDPELVGEAGFRSGEILAGRGERAGARNVLARAAACGNVTFSPRAKALLEALDAG